MKQLKLCDGRDNDCDGFADNGLFLQHIIEHGVCSDALKICGGVAGWQEPSYALIEGYEVEEGTCDGLDNDCDGVADENLSTVLANLQEGVCAGMTKVCDGAGGWTEPDYGALPTFQLTETYCDGWTMTAMVLDADPKASCSLSRRGVRGRNVDMCWSARLGRARLHFASGS